MFQLINQTLHRTRRSLQARIRRLTLCATLAWCALANPAFATKYQDIWWNANESGWGLNITQQGDILFATWYVQAQDGSPTWFTSVARKGSGETFSGGVSTARGPWFGGPWNPAAVSAQTLGNATFTFPDSRTLQLSYSAGGANVNKTLTRFTYGALRVAGDFYGTDLGQPSGCANNDRYFATSIFRVATSGTNAISIVQETPSAAGSATCTLTGSYSQAGTTLEASGNYTCSSGASGTWRARDGIFTDDAFALRITSQNGSCRLDATFAGARN
jgi:hypothetical protein